MLSATVAVAVTLATSGGVVQATSNDIKYDTTQVNVKLQADGTTPDCTIDSSIGMGTGPNKSLLLSVLTGAGSEKTLRVGVINFMNVNIIPDGPLFTCNFVIAAGAPAGPIVLTNVPGAADADGNDLTVSGANGSIMVQ